MKLRLVLCSGAWCLLPHLDGHWCFVGRLESPCGFTGPARCTGLIICKSAKLAFVIYVRYWQVEHTSAATRTDIQWPDDVHKSNSYCYNNKQQDKVINILWYFIWLQMKMNEGQTMSAIPFRAQAAAAQRRGILSRHTALSLAISIGLCLCW